MPEWVDIILPTYKRRRLLREALFSILRQSYPYWRLFVVEDSTQDGYPVIKPFLKEGKVFYIRVDRRKYPAFLRNLGASLGDAPWIAFLDSDDLWEKEKLERQISYAKETSFFWYHTHEVWLKRGKKVRQRAKHRKQGGQFIKRLFFLSLVSPSSLLVKRSFWEEKGGFLEHFPVAEDYELWIRWNFFYPVGFLYEPLTIKRSGDWEQLSSMREIDYYRVLALHRFYRRYKNYPFFKVVYPFWYQAFEKKLSILIKGAKKYQHPHKERKYQSWKKVLERIRMREERGSSTGSFCQEW